MTLEIVPHALLPLPSLCKMFGKDTEERRVGVVSGL